MTTNARGSHTDSDRDEPSESRPSDAPSGHAHSGVFRAASAPKGPDSDWVVAKQFELAGFSYLVMRRPLEPAKAAPRLTKREEDALKLACGGRNNKSIADALDVSPSTVGVLLFRAAAKLNAKSRSELLSSYEQLKSASAQPPAADDDDPEPSLLGIFSTKST